MGTIDVQTPTTAIACVTPNTLMMATYLSKAASFATNIFTFGKDITGALYSNPGFRATFNLFASGPLLYYFDSSLGSILNKFLSPRPSNLIMRFITTVFIINRSHTMISKMLRLRDDPDFGKNICNILLTELLPHIGGLLISGEMLQQDNLEKVREHAKIHYASL